MSVCLSFYASDGMNGGGWCEMTEMPSVFLGEVGYGFGKRKEAVTCFSKFVWVTLLCMGIN